MEREKEMIRAAKSGNAVSVRQLLKHDPRLIDARDKEDSTPLHCAAWKGHAEVVKILIEAGADPNLHNKNSHWGTTALHAAAHGNQKSGAEVLLAYGADTTARNFHNRTPLAETGVHNATAVANVLRKSGAEE